MTFDEGLSVVVGIIMIAGMVISVIYHRMGRWSLPMTVGVIILMFGLAVDTALPSMVPFLAPVGSRAAMVQSIGIAVCLVTWFVERSRKKKAA